MKIIKKIIKTIVLLVVILFVLVIVLTKSCIDKVTKEQENIEYKCEGDGDKVLILYQNSLMGLTKKVYTYTLENLKSNDCEITSNHPRQDNNYNIENFDIIIFISPVYMGKIAKPIEDFCKNKDFNNNKVFILLTGSIDDTNEINALKQIISNPMEVISIKVNKISEQIDQKITELLD